MYLPLPKIHTSKPGRLGSPNTSATALQATGFRYQTRLCQACAELRRVKLSIMADHIMQGDSRRNMLVVWAVQLVHGYVL